MKAIILVTLVFLVWFGIHPTEGFYGNSMVFHSFFRPTSKVIISKKLLIGTKNELIYQWKAEFHWKDAVHEFCGKLNFTEFVEMCFPSSGK